MGGGVERDGKRLMREERENERKKLSNNKPGSEAGGKLSFGLNPGAPNSSPDPIDQYVKEKYPAT